MASQEDAVSPKEHYLKVNGINLCVFEWPGDGPPVLFVHATGHHARCWDAVARRMPGQRAYAVDLRGHGRSDKPAPPYLWNAFAEDVAAAADAFGLRNIVGVGHSMGGHVVASAALLRPRLFSAMLLVDPTIPSPNRPLGQRPGGEHPVARRRDLWASPEEMFANFKERLPFSTWTHEALWDYCRFGLLPNPDGQGYVLACPPQVEAAVYGGGITLGLLNELSRLTFLVRVLRARPRVSEDPADNFRGSITWPELAQHLPQGQDVSMPECSHFIPQEAPDAVAWHINELLDVARRNVATARERVL